MAGTCNDIQIVAVWVKAYSLSRLHFSHFLRLPNARRTVFRSPFGIYGLKIFRNDENIFFGIKETCLSCFQNFKFLDLRARENQILHF